MSFHSDPLTPSPAMLPRFHPATFLLGVVTMLFLLHAWQLYSVRSTALSALEQSKVNAENIQQLADFLGARAQETK